MVAFLLLSVYPPFNDFFFIHLYGYLFVFAYFCLIICVSVHLFVLLFALDNFNQTTAVEESH